MSEPGERVPRLRVFAAVNFPIAVTRKIADEAQALAAQLKGGSWRIAWVPAANLHLTLKFFGMVAAPSVEALIGRLARELATRAPFEMEARGLGAFPSPAHPRVLWAGVKESAPLAALRDDVERWMEETGFPREPRPFHPHVTIARVKEAGAPPLAPLLQARESTAFGGGRVTEVVVYESRTGGAGSEYHALGRAAFKKTS